MNARILYLPTLALACGLALSIAWAGLKPRIAENQQQHEARQLLEIAGDGSATITAVAPSTWAVSEEGNVTAWIFEVVTDEGYNGRIALWLGVDTQGRITGVRVKSHRETPGLGDRIELAVSDWILGFDEHSTRTPARSWDVTRYGGEFDQFTGATITPRAVVHAVRDGLETWKARHHEWQPEDPEGRSEL